MDTTIHSPLMTPRDLSVEIGVSVGQLAQMRYLGTGPTFIKVGSRVRYRRSEIDRWLQANTHGTTA